MPIQPTYNTTSFSSQISPKSTPVFYPASTGKEKDSETGYYYFGARYYNPDLSQWLSVDPMADKYPSLSPYNYCAWNPMKLVDPDGAEMDEWKIDMAGNVTWEKSSKRNILYAVDKRGKKTSQIELTDEGILKQLANTKKCKQTDAVGMTTREGKIETATSTNKNDIAKLFLFVSQNTNVEWSVYSFSKGEESKYGIGTFQWDDLSPNMDYFKGTSGWKITSMIHCHPRPLTNKDELSSLYGDLSVAQRCDFHYYTYMSQSKNLYKINRNGSYRLLGKKESIFNYMK